MPKPAKKEAIISNTDSVKNLLKRASQLEDDMDAVREEKKDLGKELKAAGVNKKAFSVALRILRNPPDKEFTDIVNSYLQEGGQYAFFA